jgi:dolichol-phosphate mannosyltransferase
LAGLELDSVSSAGYCFQVDLARRAVESHFRVLEVPITFVERERGTSKMTGAIVREALWRVSGWGLLRLARRAGGSLAAVRRGSTTASGRS